MRTWQSGTKRLELAVEVDADVAVRDQAVRAVGGSRGELGAIILRPMGACIFLLCTSWGGGSHEPGGESYFHTLVMRGGSLEGSGGVRVLEGFFKDR